jgi:cytochrome P450
VVVSARREVQEVLHNPDVYSSAGACGLPAGHSLSPFAVASPAHGVLRAALDPLLSPTKIVDVNKMIRYVAGELIDGLVGEEEIDFAARFSVPFPAQVLTMILGLPVDDLGWLLDLKTRKGVRNCPETALRLLPDAALSDREPVRPARVSPTILG